MADPRAMHDGSDGGAIGAGDQVFVPSSRGGHVSAASVMVGFPLTTPSVVTAALYELHRGDTRSLADVLGDGTRTRFSRGPAAGDEGAARANVDAPGTPAIGRLDDRPVGPIRSYLELGGLWDAAVSQQLPWCGSFAAFVYARCGIDVKKGFMSAYRVPRQLSLMPLSTGYVRLDTANPATGEMFSTRASSYCASHALSAVDLKADTGQPPQSVPLSGHEVAMPSPHDLDIRPGDVAWLMHDRTHGHVVLIAAVQRNDHSVDLVTIEGNANDQVRSNIRTINIVADRISGPIVGWGRPGVIAQAPPADAIADAAAADAIANFVGASIRDV